MTYIIIFVIVLIYIYKINKLNKKYINENRGISREDAISKLMESELKLQKKLRIEKLNQILNNHKD